MVRFSKSRKQGQTDLTCKGKNSGSYLYDPEDISELRAFIERESKSKEKPQKSEESSTDE